MTAGLLLGTAESLPTAALADAAPRPAGLLALSPRLALLALREPTGTNRPAEAVLSGPTGPLRAPLSWQSLAVPAGRLHLLLARAQPGLEPEETLRLASASGSITPLMLEAAGDAAALLGTAEPGPLLQLLRFVAGKALGIFRAAEDTALA